MQKDAKLRRWPVADDAAARLEDRSARAARLLEILELERIEEKS